MHLLATKLFVPRVRPDAVPRPRLVEKLHDGLRSGHRLTLVSAPAGFGKTTLLAEWVADARQQDPSLRVAWLSLDASDNDPARFVTYLVSAVNRADPAIGAASPGASAAAPQVTLTTLINEISQRPNEILLVLDDFQFIEDTAIRDALVFLLDHVPPGLHLVIASRSDPLLPVARLRAGGTLTEVRAADLRFTPDEAAGFLKRMTNLDLSAADVAALENRTEGWIAGLQLAALSMRESTDVSGFIAGFTGSNRFVIDYLVEEVLQRQPAHLRDFLVRTAILDRLTGDLCDAVTGGAGGSEVLASLERDNLFVVALDDRRQWYRYHHLFAEVLRARLAIDAPKELPRLHGLASQWHEQHDFPGDAVEHALAGKDFDRAANLIELAVPAVRQSRQDATLLRWLTLLPPEIVERRPVLSVFCAWSALVAGDIDTVEPRLRHAELALSATTDGDTAPHQSVSSEELQRLPVTIEVYRAALAQARGDVPGMNEHAQRARNLTRPGDHLGRGAAAGFLGLASWATGNLAAGLQAFGEVRTSLRLAGNVADMLGTTVVLADMLVQQGRLREAQRAYEEALELAGQQSGPPPQSTGDLHVGLSELLRERNDLTSAAGHLAASEALGEGATSRENRYRWFVASSRIKEAEGHHAAALDLLAAAERHYRRGYFPEIRPIPAMKARVWIVQGRLAEARAWATGQGLSKADDLSYLREFDHITLARLLIAQNGVDPRADGIRDALGLLDRLLGAADDAHREGSVNEVLVLQALAWQALDHTSEALVPLKRALAQAEPEGYCRLFVDEGMPMAALLRAADNEGFLPGYVRRLGSAVQRVERRTGGVPPIESPLSERELHVLRLLASELTGPQIAHELFISLNTLRTHTKHIFGKLAVTSRAAAVRQAEALGLLEYRTITTSITLPGDAASPQAFVDSDRQQEHTWTLTNRGA